MVFVEKEPHMRKFLISAFAVAGLTLAGANLRAEDTAKEGTEGEGVKGILIDKKCGTDKKTEAEAAEHKMSCVLACEESGLGVFHKDKWIQFDEKGTKLAHEYLSDKKNTSTKVHVAGKVSEDGKTIAVEAIHAQDGEEGDGDDKDDKKKEDTKKDAK